MPEGRGPLVSEVGIRMGRWRDGIIKSVPFACYRCRSITTETREKFGGLRGPGLSLGGGQAIWSQGCLAATAVDAEEVPQFGGGGGVSARRIGGHWFPGEGQARKVAFLGGHTAGVQVNGSAGGSVRTVEGVYVSTTAQSESSRRAQVDRPVQL